VSGSAPAACERCELRGRRCCCCWTSWRRARTLLALLHSCERLTGSGLPMAAARCAACAARVVDVLRRAGRSSAGGELETRGLDWGWRARGRREGGLLSRRGGPHGTVTCAAAPPAHAPPRRLGSATSARQLASQLGGGRSRLQRRLAVTSAGRTRTTAARRPRQPTWCCAASKLVSAAQERCRCGRVSPISHSPRRQRARRAGRRHGNK
jgi:hypothetical protein